MIATLTPRQNEVLDLLIAGCSTRQICQALVISPATARNHVQAILDTLQVHSRLEAVAYASHHDNSEAQQIIDICRSKEMSLAPWQENAIHAVFAPPPTPPPLPVSYSGVRLMAVS